MRESSQPATKIKITIIIIVIMEPPFFESEMIESFGGGEKLATLYTTLFLCQEESMYALKSLNVAIRFLLELCVLLAVGYWGFTSGWGWFLRYSKFRRLLKRKSKNLPAPP